MMAMKKAISVFKGKLKKPFLGEAERLISLLWVNTSFGWQMQFFPDLI
jgi:hypothetical protein